jgi:hypothetical protein
MRKRLISSIPIERAALDKDGIDLANIGMVEITSEDEGHLIEHALQLGETRAGVPLAPGLRLSAFCSTTLRS